MTPSQVMDTSNKRKMLTHTHIFPFSMKWHDMIHSGLLHSLLQCSADVLHILAFLQYLPSQTPKNSNWHIFSCFHSIPMEPKISKWVMCLVYFYVLPTMQLTSYQNMLFQGCLLERGKISLMK